MLCSSGLGSSSRHLLRLGRVIFQDAVKTISKAEESDGGLDLMSSVIEQLQVSTCWGHQHSSLLLATLHLAGLGIPVDLEQVGTRTAEHSTAIIKEPFKLTRNQNLTYLHS